MEHEAEPLAVTASVGRDAISNVTMSSETLKRCVGNMLKVDSPRWICLKVTRRPAHLYRHERRTFEEGKA